MSMCRGNLARTGEAKIVLTGHDSLARHPALAVAFAAVRRLNRAYSSTALLQ